MTMPIVKLLDAEQRIAELEQKLAHYNEVRNAAMLELGRVENENLKLERQLAKQSMFDNRTFMEERKRLEAQNLALMTAAMRYQWLCANRDVLLITGIFGNGCVNKTISDVNNFIDSKLAIQPTSDLLAERDRKRDAALLIGIAKKHFAPGHGHYEQLELLAAARLDGSWVPELGEES